MICIYPDCAEAFPDTEAGKRQLINHINHDHDDAHVLIACAHELREVERFMARTRNPKGEEIEVGEQVKSECVRCGQMTVEDVPTVEVVKDELGNDHLSIPAKDDVQGVSS